MAACYTLKVVTDFAAAHRLRGHPGPCSRLHGHNWRVEVEVSAAGLDELGMAVDFADIKAATREVIQRLDHRNLNELAPFDRANPTAENIAAHLFEQIGRVLDTERVRVRAVTLWETDHACVRYTEE
ncbi:MAG: 6-carboxytetrahydropterin synthase QueD [Gammaproteobacteria bacterium]|nr:6-carboxytetrahydropterin synthase QueD [Gammaproteobacteria bacterium]NIR85427.1 6-carboxytetrahydropterin synthase QueD [Gammaproteobacteria bacterium]